MKLILVIVIVAVVLYFGWLFFMSYETCDDKDCFNANLVNCVRTKYTGGTNMIYEYIILGKNSDMCDVQVKLVQGELNNQESIALEGKQMRCSLPLGVVMNPESDIGNCHGPLKEGLQDLIIQSFFMKRKNSLFFTEENSPNLGFYD